MTATAVLLSGGLDSAVLAAAEARSGEVQPIYVSTGLAWERGERAALDRLLATAPFRHNVARLTRLSFTVEDLYPATHWALRGEPPAFDTPDEDVFLAGRNVVLLSKAAIYCSQHGIGRIALGPLAGNPFPDATPQFFETMASALSLGLAHSIVVDAPFAAMEKSAVIRLGMELGVPLEVTLSCMNPQDGRHCGRCSKCRERRDAFNDAGVEDRTSYAVAPPLPRSTPRRFSHKDHQEHQVPNTQGGPLRPAFRQISYNPHSPMTLAPGTCVGVYEVVSLLGAGGMGEVYRARDSRLQRDVALKILPDVFAADPDRLARFEREAQVLASLAHPNIGHIYGLEESGTSRALVLELIEGPTLADRIARGGGPEGPPLRQTGESVHRHRRGGPSGPPIPIDEALHIARQIADALDAAHEHGVIHRDLKPANVKVRDDGTVKVLDFGLAKLSGPAEAGSAGVGAGFSRPDMTASPTMSAAFTGAGIILGTAAYMAPEQARGKVVDKRADIWAFGCVLFEMLAGKRAFDGTDATEVIAAIVRAEPDWSALSSDTPPRLRTLLKRCLEKDPKQRLRDIGDVRFELDEVLRAPTAAEAAATSVARAPLWRRAIPVAAAVVVSTAVAGYLVWTLRPEPARPLARFVVTLPDGEQFSNTGRHAVAISPLGTHIAYSANGRLNLRALDQLDPLPLRGTEGDVAAATSGRNPFFSPDGQWVGLWHDGQLKKVSLTGGAPVALCAADIPWGASWGADDMILFGQGPKGIMRVSGAGGTPEVLITVDAGQSAHGPQMLPGGRAVLFTLRPQGALAWDDSQIVVQSLNTGDRKVLINGGTDARYVPTGHLVYALQGTLLAVPFDLEALEVTGGPVPLVEEIARTNAEQTGAAHFSTSADGTLVYISDTSGALVGIRRSLVWVDRQGREELLKAPVRGYRYPRLSPDGQRVALDIVDEQRDIWIWHLTGETLTRLTLDPATEQYGVWTADSRRVIFSSSRAGVPNLFWQAADGTGAVERLTESQNFQFPMTVSPNGTSLVVREDRQGQLPDLMLSPLQGERRLAPLVQTPFREMNAEISPDGRWIAYQSAESGREEIYVRPFPNVNEGRWQVSTSGGTRPLWARSGQELFYITSADDALMSTTISGTPAFKSSNPTKILDMAAYSIGGQTANVGRTYDVSPDGRRFLMIKQAAGDQTAAPPQILVVQNWLEELKRRVPAP